MRLPDQVRRVLLAAGTAAVVLAAAAGAPASASASASGDPSGYTGVERLASPDTDAAADQAEADSWTPEEMESAIPADSADDPSDPADPADGEDLVAGPAGPPSGPVDLDGAAPATGDAQVDPASPALASTPTNGIPTVGMIFYRIGRINWRCTGTVINTPTKNIIATAGHCIFKYVPMPAGVFVPGYHKGQAPYGKWSVKSRWVAAKWRHDRNPDFDYGFEVLNNLNGRRIQDVTGANGWRTNAGHYNSVEITAYPLYPVTRDLPLQCFTSTEALWGHYWHVQFPCDGFSDGVSGSLLIENYNGVSRLGTAIASIGGVDDGGTTDNVSNAVLWNGDTAALLNAAVRGQ